MTANSSRLQWVRGTKGMCTKASLVKPTETEVNTTERDWRAYFAGCAIRINQGWGHESKLFRPLFSIFSLYCRNARCMLNIKFVFDRCRHRWADVTPVKCEIILMYLTGTFAKSETHLTEKVTNGTLAHLPLVPHICDSKLDQHWFR